MKEQSRGRAWSTFGYFPVFGHRYGAVLVTRLDSGLGEGGITLLQASDGRAEERGDTRLTKSSFSFMDSYFLAAMTKVIGEDMKHRLIIL